MCDVLDLDRNVGGFLHRNPLQPGQHGPLRGRTHRGTCSPEHQPIKGRDAVAHGHRFPLALFNYLQEDLMRNVYLTARKHAFLSLLLLL